MIRGIFLLAVAVTLVGCEGDENRIDVMLVTDYVPVSEFTQVKTELATADGVATEFLREQVFDAASFDPDEPVASFGLDARGSYLIRLSLLDAMSAEVASDSARVEVSGRLEAAIVIRRPGASDGGRDATPPDAGGDAGPGDGGLDAAPDTSAPDAGPRPFCDSADDSLVGCWTFDEGRDDGSRYGHTLEAPSFATTSSPWGSALDVNAGVDVRIARPPETLRTRSAVSFEAWVRFSELPSTERMSMLERSSEYAIHFQRDGSVSCVIVTTASGAVDATAAAPEAALETDVFAHWACVYDGEDIVLYKDGAPLASRSERSENAQDDGPLVLGADAPGGTTQIRGLLDEVRIFRAARTPEQIRASSRR